MAEFDVGKALTDFFNALARTTSLTDAAIVMSAAGIIEQDLERCIKTKFRSLNKNFEARLFEGYGPLASFAAKIDVTHALSITSDELHAELNKLRKLRNAFAHTAALPTFTTEPMSSLFAALKKPTNATGSYQQVFLECVLAIDDDLERYLAAAGVPENVRSHNRLLPEQ
jgi:DNA-binding MltR family transcriptional regulator